MLAVMVSSAVRPLGAQDAPVGTLTVRVSGFRHANGTAMVALVDATSFLERNAALRQQSLPIGDGEATWVVRNVAYGSYAVQAYHDENSNRRLDRNFLGIPSEPYGFSNGARSSLRAPTYAEAAFTVAADAMTIEIRVR
jgi:uncharacterized protein (DUF2141 family)